MERLVHTYRQGHNRDGNLIFTLVLQEENRIRFKYKHCEASVWMQCNEISLSLCVLDFHERSGLSFIIVSESHATVNVQFAVVADVLLGSWDNPCIV